MFYNLVLLTSRSVGHSLRKTVGKASPILVTLTSRSDSDVESSNVSLKENKPDGVNPNSNDIDYYVRKNEGKILWFSADCTVFYWYVVTHIATQAGIEFYT